MGLFDKKRSNRPLGTETQSKKQNVDEWIQDVERVINDRKNSKLHEKLIHADKILKKLCALAEEKSVALCVYDQNNHDGFCIIITSAGQAYLENELRNSKICGKASFSKDRQPGPPVIKDPVETIINAKKNSSTGVLRLMRIAEMLWKNRNLVVGVI